MAHRCDRRHRRAGLCTVIPAVLWIDRGNHGNRPQYARSDRPSSRKRPAGLRRVARETEEGRRARRCRPAFPAGRRRRGAILVAAATSHGHAARRATAARGAGPGDNHRLSAASHEALRGSEAAIRTAGADSSGWARRSPCGGSRRHRAADLRTEGAGRGCSLAAVRTGARSHSVRATIVEPWAGPRRRGSTRDDSESSRRDGRAPVRTDH
jgi:hypothetical protein